MKTKWLILYSIFFLTTAEALSQDTSKLSVGTQLKRNPDTLSTLVDSNAPKENLAGKPHAVVNANRGTSIPATTSGTLNSSVNPNTQFVIPFHKKRKIRSDTTPGPGVIIPKR